MDAVEPFDGKAVEQHVSDLVEQLVDVRNRRWIAAQALDRHLQLPGGVTRSRESGRYAVLLTEFVAWSRALGLAVHLVDEFGRVLPSWSFHRLPHETDAVFEACRIMRGLNERRRALPCDLTVLAEYLRLPELAPRWYDRWMLAMPSPNLLQVAGVCVALDVRLALVRCWHADALASVHQLQADFDRRPDVAPASDPSAS